MALHGEVKINHQEILYWEAVRQSKLGDEDKSYDYKVQVHAEGGIFEGYLAHNYADGAAVLASKVLSWYANETKGPRQ